MNMIKKFYFPLTVGLQERGTYGWNDNVMEADGEYAYIYREIIERCIDGYDPDLLEYFDESETAKAKMQSMVWGVEAVNNCLYGKVTVELTSELTTEETKIVKDYICGQNSDGFGEGFEQHAIKVGYDEEIYVSFWYYGDGYWIYDEDEFNRKIRKGN